MVSRYLLSDKAGSLTSVDFMFCCTTMYHFIEFIYKLRGGMGLAPRVAFFITQRNETFT